LYQSHIKTHPTIHTNNALPQDNVPIKTPPFLP
jgi:hypothetical protein